MEINEISRIAYHEASHAVFCYLLRVPFSKVSIMADDESFGRVTTQISNIDSLEYGKKRKSSIRHILVSFAGFIGEQILTGEQCEQSEGDKDAIIDIAFSIASDANDAQRIIDETEKTARAMLDNPKNWQAVQALANYLQEKKVVGRKKAREIIQASLSEK